MKLSWDLIINNFIIDQLNIEFDPVSSEDSRDVIL